MRRVNVSPPQQHMSTALRDQWPVKPWNASTRSVCVFMCVCRNDDEIDIPFRDEPEDKQNEPRFGMRRLFIGSACRVPQPSGCSGTKT